MAVNEILLAILSKVDPLKALEIICKHAFTPENIEAASRGFSRGLVEGSKDAHT